MPGRATLCAHRGRNRMNRRRDEVGPWGCYPIIHVLPVVAVLPAVERTFGHRGHIVRDEVAADLVSLINRGPESFDCRLTGHADRVTQPGGEYAAAAAYHI